MGRERGGRSRPAGSGLFGSDGARIGAHAVGGRVITVAGEEFW